MNDCRECEAFAEELNDARRAIRYLIAEGVISSGPDGWYVEEEGGFRKLDMPADIAATLAESDLG